MKAVVLGGHGMLGQALAGPFPHARRLSEQDADIRDERALREAIEEGTELVINAAAFTKVDACETDPVHWEVNGKAVGLVARRCREVGARLVQISTDYVFDGTKGLPYLEDDPTCPVNAYGAGKLEGEKRAQELPGALVVRTSWLFGLGGWNFVEAILRQGDSGRLELRVVDDQVGRPTGTSDLADAIGRLVSSGASGLVHFTNAGETSWAGFARRILELEGRDDVRVVGCATADYPLPARRPAYSVLSTERYSRLTGHLPRTWDEALLEYFSRRRARA